MPYCMYLRKSRADADLEARGAGETLERHKKDLTTLANKLSLPIAEVYREIVSGETISARPEMQRLLKDVEEGRWEGVFVMEVERLARGDTIDQGTIAKVFKIHSTKIITPTKTYDPNDEFDEEYFEFGLFMSRREYKTINRRIQRGRIASVKEGKFISSTPPFGYDKIKSPDGKGYTLTPNPDEAPIVKRIFADYLAGTGSTVIANTLSLEGVSTRSGNPWSPSSVRDILKNPVYKGIIRWSYKKELKSTVDGVLHKKRSKSKDCILAPGKHPPLVLEEDFDAVQKLMLSNTKNTTRKDRTLQNPLSGLVYCKECGKLMNRVGENNHLRYATLTCKTYKCPTVASPLALIEKKVLEILEDYYENYDVYFKSPETAKTTITDSAVKKMQKQLTTLTAQIDKTYTLLEQGVYTIETFTERQQKLSAERAELEQKIQTATEAIAKAAEAALPTKGDLGTILTLYKQAVTAEAKNKLLKRIIKRIDYTKTTPNTRGRANNITFTLDLYLTL